VRAVFGISQAARPTLEARTAALNQKPEFIASMNAMLAPWNVVAATSAENDGLIWPTPKVGPNQTVVLSHDGHGDHDGAAGSNRSTQRWR